MMLQAYVVAIVVDKDLQKEIGQVNLPAVVAGGVVEVVVVKECCF